MGRRVCEIKDVVHDVVAGLDPGGESELETLWIRILPDAAAGHARLVGVRDGVAVIAVDSAAWRFQLNLQRDRLVRELRSVRPGIRKIVFQIGSIT